MSSISQGDATAEAIFAMPHPEKDKPSYAITQDQAGNVVLVALDSVTPHQLNDEQKTQFASQVQQGSLGALFDSLLSSLRSEAKIKMGNAAQEQQ